MPQVVIPPIWRYHDLVTPLHTATEGDAVLTTADLTWRSDANSVYLALEAAGCDDRSLNFAVSHWTY
jgi:hypothetical protein